MQLSHYKFAGYSQSCALNEQKVEFAVICFCTFMLNHFLLLCQVLGWSSMRRFWPITCRAPLLSIKRDICTRRSEDTRKRWIVGPMMKMVTLLFCVSSEGEECHLPAAVVRPQGQPALLSGAARGPPPAGGHRAGGLRRAALGLWRTVRLLPGVWRTRAQDLQVCSRGSSDTGELGEGSALSQPLLPLPAGPRPGPPVWR